MQCFLIEKIVRYLRWVFLCVLFLAFYIYFFSLYKFHLFYLEQTQLFRFPGDYFQTFFKKAGDFIFYPGEFLSQFFVHPFLGAGIVTVLAGITYLLSNMVFNNPEIQTDSCHIWLSDSCRLDGLYTRLYFSHMDERGNFSKPFILPQVDPLFYDRFLKSYNIPELVKSQVKLDPRIISGELKKKPIKVKYSSKF